MRRSSWWQGTFAGGIVLLGMSLVAPVPAVANPLASATTLSTAASVVPFVRYVDVSVATAWTRAGGNRPGLDDPAIANPAHPRQWVQSMTVAQKLALSPLLETQALYGTKVTVDAQSAVNGLLWDHVWVDGQPTPRDTARHGG